MNVSVLSMFTSLDIFLNRCTVGTQTDLHAHRFLELAYVAAGRGTHEAGGERRPVAEGDIVLINYSTPHRFTAGAQPLEICNCIFTPSFLAGGAQTGQDLEALAACDFLRELPFDPNCRCIQVHAAGTDNLRISNLYDTMQHEYDSRPAGCLALLRCCLKQLLIVFFRLQQKPENEKYAGIQNACEYLRLHYAEKLSIAQLARISLLGCTDFGRKFKAAKGMTPTAFVQKVRMEEACRALISTGKNVQTIAGEVGYSDLKHFYSVFRRFTGVTPSAFRRRP